MTKYRLSQLFFDDITFLIHKIDNGHEQLVAEFGVNEIPAMIDKFKDSKRLAKNMKELHSFLLA